MKRILATLALALVLIAVPTPAAADTGSYTTTDGQSCTWFGSGSFYSVNCSGYSWRTSTYTSYSCTVTVIGSMQSWNCRDSRGATWSGSR